MNDYIYIQIDKETNNVTGYSFSYTDENDIKIDIEKIDQKFLNVPLFYKYDDKTNSVVFNKTLKEEVEQDHNDKPLTDIEVIAQSLSQSQIEIMMLKKQIQELLKANGGK